MNVLCVRLSAMGDVVQSLGALAALAQAMPAARIHVAVQAAFAPLLQGLPWVARVIEHDRGAGLAGIRATGRAAREAGCDVALDLQGNWKSAAVVWCSRATRRIGMSGPWRQEPLSAVLLGESVSLEGPRHPAACALAVVRALAPAARLHEPALAATEQEVAAAARAVRAAGVDPGRPFRVVLLADPQDPRSQRPAALLREVRAAELPVLLLAGPGEAAVEAPVAVPLLRQQKGELRILVGLGHLVAQLGGDVVGGDQGPLHVLAACGARTHALFGPQDALATAPPAARVLVQAEPPACMPCRERTCSHRDGPVCTDLTSASGSEQLPPHWFKSRMS